MQWARDHEHVVFTHDLDYGALLYATNASAPSVIQIRGEELRPQFIGDLVMSAIRKASVDLLAGALVTIDPHKMRISTLPLGRKG